MASEVFGKVSLQGSALVPGGMVGIDSPIQVRSTKNDGAPREPEEVRKCCT